MPVQIISSKEMTKPSLVMTIYSMGGVGKTTLATTAPKPIFIDAENGTKALGARGIDVAVMNVSSWLDVQEGWNTIKNSEYETIVIDPVGNFLDLLVEQTRGGSDMNLKKWGEVKDKMRRFITTIKNSGKHVVFVAHEKEERDDDQVLRRPMLAANLWGEMVNICDVVGHLRIDADGTRSLRVQPEPKYYAKDRFDCLGETIKGANITEIINKIHAKFE